MAKGLVGSSNACPEVVDRRHGSARDGKDQFNRVLVVQRRCFFFRIYLFFGGCSCCCWMGMGREEAAQERSLRFVLLGSSAKCAWMVEAPAKKALSWPSVATRPPGAARTLSLLERFY